MSVFDDFLNSNDSALDKLAEQSQIAQARQALVKQATTVAQPASSQQTPASGLNPALAGLMRGSGVAGLVHPGQDVAFQKQVGSSGLGQLSEVAAEIAAPTVGFMGGMAVASKLLSAAPGAAKVVGALLPLVGAGIGTGIKSFGQSRGKGKSKDEALAGAAVDGAIEGGLTAVGIGAAKAVSKTASLANRLFGMFGSQAEKVAGSKLAAEIGEDGLKALGAKYGNRTVTQAAELNVKLTGDRGADILNSKLAAEARSEAIGKTYDMMKSVPIQDVSAFKTNWRRAFMQGLDRSPLNPADKEAWSRIQKSLTDIIIKEGPNGKPVASIGAIQDARAALKDWATRQQGPVRQWAEKTRERLLDLVIKEQLKQDARIGTTFAADLMKQRAERSMALNLARKLSGEPTKKIVTSRAK